MSKLKYLFLIVIGSLAAAFICHTFWIEPFCHITYAAWNLTTATIGGFTSSIAADPSTALMASGGSIIAVGGLAYKALGSLKDKFSKQVSEISVSANNKIQQIKDQKDQLQTANDALTLKIEELENLPDPTEALKKNLDKTNHYKIKSISYNLRILKAIGNNDHAARRSRL